MSRSGHNAQNIAKQYGANYSTTDYNEILNDSEIDIIMICSRHDLHASYVLEAIKKQRQ